MNEINKLMDEIKEQCGDCEAWSGTDCTRNPYTQGCLKDEKKPTDEEVIRLLEIFANDDEPDGVDRLARMALDLIHRLQAENERLTEERQSLVTKLNQTDEAVDYWCDKFKAEKAEKDELTDKLGKVLSTVGIDEYKQSKAIEQAVNDTADEIYDFVKEYYSSDEDIFGERLKEFIKQYGVEVE